MIFEESFVQSDKHTLLGTLKSFGDRKISTKK